MKWKDNMMYLLLNDVVFLVAIFIFLVIIYRRIVQNWNVIEKFKQRYSESDKNTRIQNRIKYISRQPIDKQKLIFSDLSFLVIVMLIIFLIGTKSIFFAAVVSGSMSPTFDKNDLVLIQNIDRSFNVGDIVMFERPDTSLPISHRVISITGDEIRTAGDATKTMDWWKLKREDIVGKAIVVRGEPIVIKGLGTYFVVEDRNQRFGPFDYMNYYLFIGVIKAYGLAIALISLFIYIAMTFRNNEKEKYRLKMSKYNMK